MSTYRIDDEHGTEISCGYATQDAAETAATRWESEHHGRRAYVSADDVGAEPGDESSREVPAPGWIP